MSTRIQDHWDHVVGKLKERWGQLGEDELLEFDGDLQQLVGFIELRTTETREAIADYVNSVLEEFAGPVERTRRRAGEYAERSGEAVAGAYDRVKAGVQEGCERASQEVRSRPLGSVAVAFASGLVAGVLVALTLRSR